MFSRHFFTTLCVGVIASFSLLPALFSYTFAQTAQDAQADASINACDNISLVLEGPSELKKGEEVVYQTYISEQGIAQPLLIDENIDDASVLYRLFYKGKLVTRSSDTQFSHTFDDLGIYEISATVSIKDCTLVDTLTIRSYNDVFFYFGSFLADFNKGIQQNIQQQDILFSSFIVDGGVDNVLDDTIVQDLSKKLTDIRHSEVFYFNLENFSHVFTLLDWLENQQAIDFANKKVVLVSVIDPTLLKKFLAPFIKETSYSLFITTVEDLRDVFYSLSVGDVENVSQTYSAPIKFVGGGFTYSLSRFVDILIYYGFPMDVVSILLVLSLCICLLVFVRQIIGVSVFGLYFPLLMAITFVMIGEPTALLFFALAFVSHYTARLFYTKLNMLVYAKIGFYLIVYVFFTLLLLGIATLWTNYQWNLGGVSDIVVVIAYLLMPVIGKKVFSLKKGLLSYSFWSSLVRFLLISYGISHMILSQELQYWLLVRPEILLLFLVLIVLFGKFTGLQLSEYIRFWPVIKKEIFSKKPKKIGAKRPR